MTKVQSTIQCVRWVESGGCESQDMIDVEVEGEFYPAERDVGCGAEVHDIVGFVVDMWGRRHETYLTEDEESDAERELLAVADERGLK
jgi:hypothetical protein